MVSSRLPGGVSPAHNDLDPYYAMLAEAKVPITFHIGGELSFLHSAKWGEAEAFEGFMVNDEVSMDPWRLTTIHLGAQNFIATMVMGGVFERHPALRVGALEVGASWIGPLANMLDIWHDNNLAKVVRTFNHDPDSKRLPMRPSEYICRNIRISPFDFEPVDQYIDHYGLADVYCFASDYPHVEGGREPMRKLSDSIGRHGPGAIEKFFVTNGEWLLPA